MQTTYSSLKKASNTDLPSVQEQREKDEKEVPRRHQAGENKNLRVLIFSVDEDESNAPLRESFQNFSVGMI